MKKSIVVLLHLAYWALYWLLISFILLATFQGQKHLPLNFFFHSPIVALAFIPATLGFYSFYFYLFDKHLNRKRILSLILTGTGIAFGAGFISCLLMSFIYGHKILFADGYNSATGIFLTLTLLAGIHGFISLVIKGFIKWFDDIKIKEDLTKKNYETELALLKSQINPHFLFNTINNIDVLIEKDAKSASAYLNKLSDIMRFMLYETRSEKIPLTKELDYIEKFIELQKIRTANTHYISYNVEGEISQVSIPPMLLISFIENAFKHSDNKKTENAINIFLKVQQKELFFKCENSYGSQTNRNPQDSGMGIELIRKRLTLIYAGKHSLSISNNNGLFSVELSIQLS